jgi:hypothetical protein
MHSPGVPETGSQLEKEQMHYFKITVPDMCWYCKGLYRTVLMYLRWQSES